MEPIVKINKLLNDLKNQTVLNGRKRLNKKDSILWKFYNDCKAYIETKPRKEFIEAKKEQTEIKINNIVDGYSAFITSRNLNPSRKIRNEYYKEMRLKEQKKYLKNLEFILSLYNN